MHADVVIVGAGAGGAACAWALASRGVRVLVLESGPWYDPGRENRLHLPDWEQHAFPEGKEYRHAYTFAQMQALNPQWAQLRSWNHNLGQAAGDTRRALKYQHVRGVGGSTLHFVGEAHRLHPAAMRMASRFGVGADWPIAYGELERFYVEAEYRSVLPAQGMIAIVRAAGPIHCHPTRIATPASASAAPVPGWA